MTALARLAWPALLVIALVTADCVGSSGPHKRRRPRDDHNPNLFR